MDDIIGHHTGFDLQAILDIVIWWICLEWAVL